MAQRVEARPPAGRTENTPNVRPKRAREEELLVWPDLVFVEFISAVLFTITLTILSAGINGPLLDRANADVTPNPSKAPWYFLNLQELLLHMHPALAGVVVPTIALIALAAIPYFDRSHEGQGVWWGTRDAAKIAIFATVFTTVISILLIVYDGGKHVVLYDKIHESVSGKCFGPPNTEGVRAQISCWPEELNFVSNLRGLQTGIDWPEWASDIPYLPFTLELRGQEFRTLDFPGFLVEQAIPVGAMIGLPLFMLAIQYRWLGHNTKRDAMIGIFTGFIVVYVVLTIIGTAFRGEGLELYPPWEVKPPE
jgi:menaquinol-cytochrome c reductase cytochrome b/c subunit